MTWYATEGGRIMCGWFAMCDNEAAGTVHHPILGPVPTCQRCADRFGLVLEPIEDAFMGMPRSAR